MAPEEKVRKMRRTSGPSRSDAAEGRAEEGRRSRKSLPVEEPTRLSPEDVAAFDGEVLQGEVLNDITDRGQSPRRSARPESRPGGERSRRWSPADEATRQKAERIDLFGGAAVRGWRSASESELLEALVGARAEAELAVHWYDRLEELGRTEPDRVSADDVHAAREEMLERNAATGGPEWTAQAYQLRFGAVPQHKVDGLVDALVDNERESWLRSDASQRTSSTRHRTRGMFGTGAGARAKEQQARAQEALQREDLVQGDDLSERDHMRLLRMNSRLAADEYMKSLRDSNILVPGFSQEEREKGLDQRQQVYARMMMLGALRPLSNGINRNSVIQAMGAMTTMLILSPQFRAEMGAHVEPLKRGLQERIETKARAEGAKAEHRAWRHNQGQGPDGQTMDRGSFLSARWQRRLNDLERRDRGHRELYTAETAAMTEIGLAENAYRVMRTPGVQPKEVMGSYQAMIKKLHDQIREDGLDPQEVASATRTILGRRMETEPELQVMFNGMAYGKYVRSAPHQERIKGSDHTRTVWSGEFEDHLGKKIPQDAMFTLRPPLGAEHHQASIALMMQERMLHGLEARGMDGFNESFSAYMIGYAAAEKNWTGQLEGRLDGDQLPATVRAHTRQCELMLATMVSDGLDAPERQRVYSNAYTDAISHVRGLYPDFARDWDAKYGETWQDQMRAATADPGGFDARLRATGQTVGSGFAASYARSEAPSPGPVPEDDRQPA